MGRWARCTLKSTSSQSGISDNLQTQLRLLVCVDTVVT
jgi:hypothetical protein